MLSFIVIGKNEGWKLTKCFESIFKAVEYNDLKDYEIIYIDSKSTDDSIERAKKFVGIKIYQITGKCNAAISRNIGAKESKGDVLFFIDGDMEIMAGFLEKVIGVDGNLKYECVSGHLDDLFYDTDGNCLKKCSRTYKGILPRRKKVVITNGGIFLIKKPSWEIVNGMKTKYVRNEDIDLILRLCKAGIKTIRIPAIIALHYTVDYRNDKRMWKMLFSGSASYPALIARENFFNLQMLYKILRSEYTSLILFFCILSALINIKYCFIVLIPYLSMLFLRVLMNTFQANTNNKWKLFYYIERLVYQVATDFIFSLAFLFFHPSEKELRYKKII